MSIHPCWPLVVSFFTFSFSFTYILRYKLILISCKTVKAWLRKPLQRVSKIPGVQQVIKDEKRQEKKEKDIYFINLRHRGFTHT